MAEADSKRCPRCGETKPLDAFGKSKGRKHGVKGFCRPCHNATNKESRERHPESSAASSANWKKANPERHRANVKAWQARHPGRMDELVRAWRLRNPERIQENEARRRARVEYRLKRTLSSRIRALMLGKGGRRTIELVGYSAGELRLHLEKQFQVGMSWDNYGEWHIDHIVPLAAFNFASIEDKEIQRAWALSNLRPLWAKENNKKRARVLYLI